MAVRKTLYCNIYIIIATALFNAVSHKANWEYLEQSSGLCILWELARNAVMQSALKWAIKKAKQNMVWRRRIVRTYGIPRVSIGAFVWMWGKGGSRIGPLATSKLSYSANERLDRGNVRRWGFLWCVTCCLSFLQRKYCVYWPQRCSKNRTYFPSLTPESTYIHPHCCKDIWVVPRLCINVVRTWKIC